MKIAVGLFLATLASLALFTGWALESEGVAILETQTPDGTTRSTHVWFVESEGVLWLEAGTPENSWYRDVLADPVVTLSAEESAGRYVAEPIEGVEAHERIRSLLREKYGLRDWWVAVLFDTSRSVAVQLVPREG